MKSFPTFIVSMAIGVALVAHSAEAGQSSDLQHPQEHPVYNGPPLSLKAALNEALEKNPELVALRAQLGVTRERPAQERALAPPMLETTIWQWPINTLNPANTNMYMFMATQELPGRGKRDLRAAVAEKDVAIAQNDIAARARHVFDEIKQAYAQLFVSREAIEIHLANVDLLRQFADISQAKYATGRISQQDVLKAVLELSRLHDDIIMLDLDAKIATAKLNTSLDRPTDAPIGLLEAPHEQTLLPSLADLQGEALARQPEIQGARLAVERAEAAVAMAQRDRKPDYTVQAGYMVVPHQTDGVLAQVGITWPNAPWSRGRIDARVREASADIEAAKARQRSMENALRFAVQDAYVRVKAAEQRAALLRTTIVPQSEQTMDVSRIAYQTDRVDFLALLDNQRVLLNTRLDYYRALSDFEQAMADLERAVGTEISPDMLRAAAPEPQQ